MLIDKEGHLLETAQTGIERTYTTPNPDFLKNVNEDEPQIAVIPEANYVAAVIRAARVPGHLSLRRTTARSARRRATEADRRRASPNTPRSRPGVSAFRWRSR